MAADFITIAVVVVYFLGMLGIGAWASKKIKNTEDYLVAGRQLGFWVFILLMIGTVASGMSLLGVSGLGFKAGWPTIWEQIFVPLSIGFCIIFFGVKLHNVAKTAGYVTVQDYLAHRYESPTALRSLSAVAGIIVSLIYLVGQYSAIAIVLMWLFAIPLWLALVIATLITTVYTAIGGLYAVAWASLIQSIILIVGVLIMAPIIIFYAGGFDHVNDLPCRREPEPRHAVDAVRGLRDPVRCLVCGPPHGRPCLCPARDQQRARDQGCQVLQVGPARRVPDLRGCHVPPEVHRICRRGHGQGRRLHPPERTQCRGLRDPLRHPVLAARSWRSGQSLP